jgi:hypothetical protein
VTTVRKNAIVNIEKVGGQGMMDIGFDSKVSEHVAREIVSRLLCISTSICHRLVLAFFDGMD